MSLVDDMKTGKEMFGGCLIVVVILAAVAAAGYTRIGKTE